MTTFIQFPATTAAVTTNIFYSSQYDSITVSADHLAGAETVTLQCMSGTTAKQVTDAYGVVINLTSSISAVPLEGGIPYRFVKSITAAPCAVYVDTKET